MMMWARQMTAPLLPLGAVAAAGAAQPGTRQLLRTWMWTLVQQQRRLTGPLAGSAAGGGLGVQQQQQQQLAIVQQQQAGWRMTQVLQDPQLVAGGGAAVGAGLLLQGLTATGTWQGQMTASLRRALWGRRAAAARAAGAGVA